MCKFEIKSQIWILVCLAVIGAKNTWADSKDAEFDSVKVKSFVVVDSTGKERVKIGSNKEGLISMVFLDENGKGRMRLVAEKEASGMGIFDETGKPKFYISVGKAETRLSIVGKNEKEEILLAVAKDAMVNGIALGGRVIGLVATDKFQQLEFGAKGNVAAAIGIDARGKPVFDGAFSALGAPPTRAISSEPDSREDRRKWIQKNMNRLDKALDDLQKMQ